MKYAYINGTLLDGTKDMTAKDGLAILTDGEKIVDIVKSESDLSGYEIIDLKGKCRDLSICIFTCRQAVIRLKNKRIW